MKVQLKVFECVLHSRVFIPDCIYFTIRCIGNVCFLYRAGGGGVMGMKWTKKQRDGNRGRWQRSVWVCHCVLKVSENESEIDN